MSPFTSQEFHKIKTMFEGIGFKDETNEIQFLEIANRENKDSFFIVASNIYSSKLLERSLTNHANALAKSAKASEEYTKTLVASAIASEKHARSLTLATWILAVATIGLVIATLILVCVTVTM